MQKTVYFQQEDRIFSIFEDRIVSTVYLKPGTVYFQPNNRTRVYFTGEPGQDFDHLFQMS